MVRALVHPRLFTRGLGGAYNRRVTILHAIETRSPTGQVVSSWEPVPGHAEMPAAISALNTFQRSSYTGSNVRIMLQGYHPDITTKYRVVDDEGRTYDLNEVEHTYGMATRLVCETLDPGGPD